MLLLIPLLTNNVFTSVLTFKKSFKVIVVSLTSSVVEDFTSTGYSIIPVSSDTLLAVSESQRLRTDGFWKKKYGKKSVPYFFQTQIKFLFLVLSISLLSNRLGHLMIVSLM